VNADAQGGSLAVEVLDDNGTVIKGLEQASCKLLTTDTLASEQDGWVRWSTEKDLRRIKGRTLRLKFTLQNARLYSFRIADEDTINLPVPRATPR
jgi:hypothetical protein